MEPAQDSTTSPIDISSAYKRQEYGWFIFYIIAVVISVRLAGVVGAIASFLVVSALYKTVKNSAYSATKKFILSTAYVISGIIATLVAATLLTYVLAHIWPQAVVPRMLSYDPPLTSRTFTSSTTPSLLGGADTGTSFPDLEATQYTDAKLHFSISYPKGWKVDTSGTNGNVEFDDPSSHEVALETVTADNVQGYGYDFQTVVRGVLHNFKSSAGPNADIKILSEGNTTLNGEPAYEYEVTYNYEANGQSYLFHGLYVVWLHSDMAYSIFASSFEQVWDKYKNTFNESISSFKY